MATTLAMRSGNPALTAETFAGVPRAIGDEAMTIQGTVNKTALALLILLAAATYTWNLGVGDPRVPVFMMVGVFGGLIAAMATVFKPTWAPVSTPVYAALEGLALGGLSSLLEMKYPGIAMQSVALTFATLAAMLVAYRTGLIKATEKFKLGVVAATGAIAIYYVVGFVLSFFHVAMPFLQGNSTASIVVSGVIVVVAALNLILDFDFIETGVQGGAPKYLEWYGAFGLMVTLIWLYLEILRLLAKVRSRR